jgi:hypothetical protein
MNELSKEQLQRRQRQTADTFSQAVDFINTYIRAQDYFVGYTTLEAINERISQIGEDETSTTESYNGRLTKLAALNLFEANVLDALQGAKELGAIDVASYDNGVSGVIEDEYVIPILNNDKTA